MLLLFSRHTSCRSGLGFSGDRQCASTKFQPAYGQTEISLKPATPSGSEAVQGLPDIFRDVFCNTMTL
jgi:hypothetical protein